MTREEAKNFLINISYKLGNMAIEYLTEKDGEKMREAIKALEQELCDDAISRQAAIKAFKPRGIAEDVWQECNEYKVLSSLPPVNPQPKTGHWIFDEILDKHYYCSECKSMGVDYWDYCPYCGAKMEREEV